MKSKKAHNKLVFLIIIIIIYSCKNDRSIIKADLSFKSISFSSAYGTKQDVYDKLIKDADSIVSTYNLDVEHNEDSDYQNYLLSKRILKLHRLKIFKLPHIYLHLGSDSIMEVYVSEKEFDKVKHFKQVELYNEKKKVILELEIEEKDSGIFYSDNIISVKKVDGKSRSNI